MPFFDPDPKFSERRCSAMIEEQLAARGIWSERVLSAFARVKRHEFVSEALYQRAYDDTPLPIGSGQTISQPYIVAYMTQELQLAGSERVLEIGTGSGYQTAILAELCRLVVSVERLPELYEKARERLLLQLGYANIRLLLANGLEEPFASDFDRILITAGAAAPPVSLMALLRPGGFLIAPIGELSSQFLYKISAVDESQRHAPEGELWQGYPGFRFRRLAGVRFVPLIGPGSWQA